MFKKIVVLCCALICSPSIYARQGIVNKNQYIYDLSYKSIGLGQIIRDIQWDGELGVVNSTTDLSFFAIDFGGNQLSHLYRDKKSGEILTNSFTRISKGFSTVSMTAEFSKQGHHVKINNNGEESSFSNDKNKIIDFNAITMAISDLLKEGKTQFDFYMQTSDGVAHYFFEVKGKEILKTTFGDIEVFKIEQSRKNDRTFEAWFAPSINYQMIRFHYQRKILDIYGELVEYSTAPSRNTKIPQSQNEKNNKKED